MKQFYWQKEDIENAQKEAEELIEWMVENDPR